MLTPEEVEKRVRLIGSIRVALLGEITDNLYAVTCGIRDHCLYVVGYFDGPVSDEDKEMISVAATEVLSDFTDDDQITIHHEAVSIQEYKLEVMEPNGFLAFKRKRPPGPREPQPEARLTVLQAYLAMKDFVETTQWVWDPKVREDLLARLPLKRDGKPTDSSYWSIWESSVNHVLREANTGSRTLPFNTPSAEALPAGDKDPSG